MSATDHGPADSPLTREQVLDELEFLAKVEHALVVECHPGSAVYQIAGQRSPSEGDIGTGEAALLEAHMPEPLEPPDAAVTGEEVIMAERNAALRTALAGLPASCQPLMERIGESSALLGLADTGGKRPGGDPGG